MEIIGAQNLKKIEELVDIAVEEQSDKILKNAQDECDRIRASSDSAEVVSAIDNISLQQKQINEKYRSITANNKRDNERKYLLFRNECIDDIFEKVKERLTEFSKSECYVEYLKRLLENENQGFVVLLSKEDMKYANIIGFECRETDDIRIGGLMLYYENVGLMLDKSFDAELSSHRKAFAERYGKEIFRR